MTILSWRFFSWAEASGTATATPVSSYPAPGSPSYPAPGSPHAQCYYAAAQARLPVQVSLGPPGSSPTRRPARSLALAPGWRQWCQQHFKSRMILQSIQFTRVAQLTAGTLLMQPGLCMQVMSFIFYSATQSAHGIKLRLILSSTAFTVDTQINTDYNTQLYACCA